MSAKGVQNERVRESRPVPRYSDDCPWKAVADGVIKSENVDDRFQFFSPKPLPFQAQEKPAIRTPLATVNANVRRFPPHKLFPPPPTPPAAGDTALDATVAALVREIRTLEKKNNALEKRVALLETLVKSFCAYFKV